MTAVDSAERSQIVSFTASGEDDRVYGEAVGWVTQRADLVLLRSRAHLWLQSSAASESQTAQGLVDVSCKMTESGTRESQPTDMVLDQLAFVSRARSALEPLPPRAASRPEAVSRNATNRTTTPAPTDLGASRLTQSRRIPGDEKPRWNAHRGGARMVAQQWPSTIKCVPRGHRIMSKSTANPLKAA
ncbi:hypothetical protein XA68_10021 [Ophiocordyceps unilateralis]|uniref:Uncharacterized protein n=1 Tax=Ophiocordyceps unilateralis TaxID=268505 RepID=A0A2A9PTH5_OPHUN|nr:hypothetical protein XA68_10021 [Ophiocordyceps unilateralis]